MLNGLGITGVQDASVDEEDLKTYHRLDEAGELSLQVVGSIWWERDQGLEQIEAIKRLRSEYTRGRIDAGTVKIMQDGVMENYTAVVLEPYKLTGQKDVRGIPMVEPELLKKAVTQLDADGFQVHFHAIGDGAVRQSLDAIEAARTANGDLGHRHHISHIQVIHPDDQPRFRKLGVIANFQPLWAYADAYITDLTLPFISKETASYMYPIASMEKSGAVVAFGSDWSVSSANPFEEMETAITRMGALGETKTPFLPEERIGLPEALAAFTINAAYTNRDESEHGVARGRQAREPRGARPEPVRHPGDGDLGHESAGDAVRGQGGARRLRRTVMKGPRHRIDPDGRRLPIKLDTTSNGEFVPVPLTRANRHANHLAQEAADANAKRLAMGRRDFLVSGCGAASTLLAFNAANAAAGRTGGYFDLPAVAATEPAAAAATLETGEFIFDVQGHYVDPTEAWLKVAPESAFKWSPKAGCALADGKTPRGHLACLSSEEFVKDVFLDSDTDMMVLSFVPSRRDASPLEIESADNVRRIVERMEGNHRLMIHGRVNPNQPGDIEDMPRLKEQFGICAWKTYTQWGLDGKGFYLDDEVGIRFVEEARRLGVKVICVHKGLPFGPQSYEHSQCRDIGPIAKRFPDVSFLVYHSGFVTEVEEKAYGQNAGGDGIDTLIRSLEESGIRPGSNVYAELGSTWRFLMRDPEQAAHGIGKLLKHCGPDNVLWGTDSIWYGSPQDQIQAFRAFQIAPQFREKYGYPEITPELRAKIFGGNAMKPYGISAEEMKLRARRDAVSAERLAYRERPEPHFQTRGPKTRREFLNLLGWNGGSRA